MEELIRHVDQINRQLSRYGVKFGIYKNNEFHERLFPFDPLPRIIESTAFTAMEHGLQQRVLALNLFLKDIYGKNILLPITSYRKNLYSFPPAIFQPVKV